MLTSEQVIDKYYLEARCMLVEIAAMLDRVDRAEGDAGGAERNPKLDQLRQAITLLADRGTGPNRSEQVLLLFSDPA